MKSADIKNVLKQNNLAPYRPMCPAVFLFVAVKSSCIILQMYVHHK
jgi:hypothetical protein